MPKQVILVPQWLGMSPGKATSQCCHIALRFGSFTDKRVILRVEDEGEMLDLIAHALDRALTVVSFRDFGPTTENTDGKITVWAIRGPEDLVDEVTGKLELL